MQACVFQIPQRSCACCRAKEWFSLSTSCHVWGSEEPGSGSFRRHHAMIHHLVSFPLQLCLLGSAASQGSVTSHAHPPPVQECSSEGMEMAQSSLSAAVPLLVQQWHHEGCVSGCWMWGQSCPFPPLPLPVIKDKDLIIPALCSCL